MNQVIVIGLVISILLGISGFLASGNLIVGVAGLVLSMLYFLIIAKKAIQATYDFFQSIGIPMTLREVGIDESRIDEMAHHVAVNEGLENAWAPLIEKDISEIFTASL